MHPTITAPLLATASEATHSYAKRRKLYRVIVTVRQRFADRFPHCIAYKSAWLLCVGRILDLCIVREMLSYINIDPIQQRDMSV